MKIYLAGKITGNDDYVEQFKEMETLFTRLGFTVINPVKNIGFDYKDYIDMGLCELSKCDAICLLEGYQESKGAMLELQYAKTVGLTVMESSIEEIKDGIRSS